MRNEREHFRPVSGEVVFRGEFCSALLLARLTAWLHLTTIGHTFNWGYQLKLNKGEKVWAFCRCKLSSV